MTEQFTPHAHWDDVYKRVGSSKVSWFQPDPGLSLELILRVGAVRSVIDVGGGASVLADRLLTAGIADVTVLDISDAALRVARERLGPRGIDVSWIAHDLLAWQPPRRFDVWHDRAVFHFLTDAADRAAYRSVLRAALRPGGHVVIGTFAEDGPTHCSGLPVARYDATELGDQFPDFRTVAARREAHRTPAGVIQPFTWLLLADAMGEGHPPAG